MEDYVKKAQDLAEARRKELEDKRDKEKKEIERIRKLIDETKLLVYDGMKQWEGVLGIKFKSILLSWFGYLDLFEGDKQIVKVIVGWGNESRSYSDDCTVDHEGPKFELTFPQKSEYRWCDVYKKEVSRQKYIEYVGNNPEDTAKRCLEYIAEHISKEYM